MAQGSYLEVLVSCVNGWLAGLEPKQRTAAAGNSSSILAWPAILAIP